MPDNLRVLQAKLCLNLLVLFTDWPIDRTTCIYKFCFHSHLTVTLSMGCKEPCPLSVNTSGSLGKVFNWFWRPFRLWLTFPVLRQRKERGHWREVIGQNCKQTYLSRWWVTLALFTLVGIVYKIKLMVIECLSSINKPFTLARLSLNC